MARPIHLVDHDPRWADQFERERRRLMGALAPYILAVEHIGSTSVPGLPAKATIDMLVGLHRLSDAPRIIPKMEALGYVYIPEYEDKLPERRLFRQPKDRELPSAFNAHAAEVGNPFYDRHLRFRDWLRANPADRDAYAQLKRELREKHPEDLGAYTEAKTPFIRGIEARALEVWKAKPAPKK